MTACEVATAGGHKPPATSRVARKRIEAIAVLFCIDVLTARAKGCEGDLYPCKNKAVPGLQTRRVLFFPPAPRLLRAVRIATTTFWVHCKPFIRHVQAVRGRQAYDAGSWRERSFGNEPDGCGRKVQNAIRFLSNLQSFGHKPPPSKGPAEAQYQPRV